MTLEDLKKKARPLYLRKEGSIYETMICAGRSAYIEQEQSQKWWNSVTNNRYETKEDAIRALEEIHLRNLAKLFDLEEEEED